MAVFGCGSAMIFSFWTAGSSGSFGGGAAALSAVMAQKRMGGHGDYLLVELYPMILSHWSRK